MLTALSSGAPAPAISAQSEQSFDALITALDALIALNNRGAADAGERAEASANNATVTFGVILLASVIFTVFAAVLLSRSITRPLAILAARPSVLPRAT